MTEQTPTPTSTEPPPANASDLWVYEQHSDNDKAGWRIREMLFSGESDFQRVEMVDTYMYGRMLLLDGCVMTTEADEFVYHEMVVHLPLFTHPNPRRVLIVGGGDGGALREVVRHPSVEQVTMVEIDGMVVDKCKEYLPTIAAAFDHPKARVLIDDGIKFVADAEDKSYDVVIVDGTDPIGPGVGLFTPEFYRNVDRILTDDGVVVSHASQSCWYGIESIAKTVGKLRGIFPHVQLFRADIPTYPSGTWYFCVATKTLVPHDSIDEARFRQMGMTTKYYTPEVHRASFATPPFVSRGVEEYLAEHGA